jgi:perosamine synthetase
MIPRGALDIGWRDLMSAFADTCLPMSRAAAQADVERAWGEPDRTIACLSVRSGFDLFLQAVAWPPGSEVLVSAINIPDMIALLRHHGLVPVPLDISIETLSIDPARIAAACTPDTRAVLVAHLFGARTNLDSIASMARDRRLHILEDCAQAYDGTYRGHPASEMCMFSFGPIKTSTALGGGVLTVRDETIVQRMRNLQARYAAQSRLRFLKRVVQAAALKVLGRPAIFTAFAAACRAMKVDHDAVIVHMLRGFKPDDLVAQIRRAPSAALCRLLARRVRAGCASAIAQRSRIACNTRASLLHGVSLPGTRADAHCHWVLPVESRDAPGLVRCLWRRGFDATRRGSSLDAVGAPSDRPSLEPHAARRMLERVVYLPVYPWQSAGDCARLAAAVNEFEAGPA